MTKPKLRLSLISNILLINKIEKLYLHYMEAFQVFFSDKSFKTLT